MKMGIIIVIVHIGAIWKLSSRVDQARQVESSHFPCIQKLPSITEKVKLAYDFSYLPALQRIGGSLAS